MESIKVKWNEEFLKTIITITGNYNNFTIANKFADTSLK
jgi:hypothetical protein